MTILSDDFTFDLRFLGAVMGTLATIEGLYLSQFRETIRGALQTLGKGQQFFFVGTTKSFAVTVGSTTRVRGEQKNAPPQVVIIISAAIIVLLVLAINYEPKWLAYPYFQFSHAGGTWAGASPSFPYIPFGVLKGLGFLLWGLLASFVYSLVIIAFLGRSSLLVVDYLSTKFSDRTFKLLIAIQAAISAFLLL